jgi:hypothetical protein
LSGRQICLRSWRTNKYRLKPRVPQKDDTTVQAWSAQDIAFAATEVGREFPTASPEDVVAAVETATRRASSVEGRAALVKGARLMLRQR